MYSPIRIPHMRHWDTTIISRYLPIISSFYSWHVISNFFLGKIPMVPIKTPMFLVNNPIGSMYGIYANIGGILMVNVTIYGIHGSYGNQCVLVKSPLCDMSFAPKRCASRGKQLDLAIAAKLRPKCARAMGAMCFGWPCFFERFFLGGSWLVDRKRCHAVLELADQPSWMKLAVITMDSPGLKETNWTK